jgi:hypothetical protein
MKHKVGGNAIDINKQLLSGYTPEQLDQWAKDNGVEGEDYESLKGKLKGDVNTEPGPGAAAPKKGK